MFAWMVWWALALILVGAEMLTGSFYLLALGIAFAIGGIVDFLGGNFLMQLVSVGIVGSAGCFAAYYYQQNSEKKTKQKMEFDIGHRVQVLKWHDDGSARVSYRGSQWDAIAATPETPRNREMLITEVRGSLLVLREYSSSTLSARQ
ncbi:MAG: NfeD family protein [Burkholderiales bacterium]|jgi:membrane protein implicated in regulation of membrane protease activity|nr:NfeD family protein [Burkholderiales bacterium]